MSSNNQIGKLTEERQTSATAGLRGNRTGGDRQQGQRNCPENCRSMMETEE